MTTNSREIDRAVERILDELIDLGTQERRIRLRELESEDLDLARCASKLLGAWQSAPDFLERPAIDSDLFGLEAGPWILDARVALGGCGDVYIARHKDAAMDWRVAVKVLKRSAGAIELLRRFESERRTLASLNHPYIVPLVDAGILEDERPYLVTRFVDGLPLDRFVAGLPLEPRLHLFIAVCAAVSHAHERLVAHCDLKPANILVTREGLPQLLDFGIARLLDGASSSERALTPGYASPEQLRGDVLSTATDVFSLGVVLYELATGKRPFQEEPSTKFEAPSAAVLNRTTNDRAAASGATGVDARLLSRRLRPDFDAIVAKALRLEPGERYASVAELADDVRSFTMGRPIAARSTTWLRRSCLLMRRNRVATAACGVALVFVVLGVASLYRSLAMSREEARTGWRAHSEAALAARWIEDLAHGAHSDPAFAASLDAAAARLSTSPDLGPEAEGRFRMTLGALYLDADQPAAALMHLQRAHALSAVTRGFGAQDRARIAELLSRCYAAMSGRIDPPAQR